MPASTVDFHSLTEFAQGHLFPKEALEVIAKLEQDPQASRDLEFILMLMAHFENEKKESSHAEEPGT